MAEIDILWITAGLGCDGDTVAMTAATLPSREDLLSTTLLEQTIRALRAEMPLVVIEGDQATADGGVVGKAGEADRVRAAGARAVQVTTARAVISMRRWSRVRGTSSIRRPVRSC